MVAKVSSVKQLPDAIAVMVLAEFIKAPDSSIEELAQVIAKTKGVKVKLSQIESLFALHGLKKNNKNIGVTAFNALKCILLRLSEEILPLTLFPQPPVIVFVPDKNVCDCGKQLGVKKTRRKKVITLIGPIVAHQKLLECKQCKQEFRSDELLRMVQHRCTVAFDVLIFVGLALFQRYRTANEILVELLGRNIRISDSEVNYLGRKFISLLAIAHSLAAPSIREKMTIRGGYVLHLDAAHERDAPALMTSMDSLSEIVLANIKIPSENSDYIAPYLLKIQSEYGTPIACVHDMGPGICKAVSEVFPNVLDYICHFHFLRDIGKDFLGLAYNEIRIVLRKHSVTTRLNTLLREIRKGLCCEDETEITLLLDSIKVDSIQEIATMADAGIMPEFAVYSLAQWTLQGKKEGAGYGFPFDRIHLEFVCRLIELNLLLPNLLERANNSKHKSLIKLANIVSDISEDKDLCQAVEDLRWRCVVFDRLRTAMRIAPVEGNEGLNDDGTPELMASIEKGVDLFRRDLDTDPKLASDNLSKKMAKQIDKYRDKLFAGPIVVQTPNGPVTIYVQRTNNILEQFFRGVRRGYRRKTGNNTMNRALQTMLADTPLIKNLENREYMELLLNGNAGLEELFAKVAAIPIEKKCDKKLEPDRILPGFRKLIKLKDLPARIFKLFGKYTDEPQKISA